MEMLFTDSQNRLKEFADSYYEKTGKKRRKERACFIDNRNWEYRISVQ